MATTKQYNELQDGGSLQSDDKLAVARAGASELLTVPAESLAQRAAEIVSTDPMQEFVADIGLGKQLLAQALNNKGAGVTAADTLAQMAGKVDALDVVGAREYIRGRVSLYKGEEDSITAVWCNVGVKNNLALRITSGKLALVKLAAAGVLEELAAVTDADIVAGRYCSLFSNAAGTAAVYFNPKSTTASQVLVFDVNAQAGTLALRGKIENLIVYSTTSSINFSYISESGDRAVLFTQDSSDVASINWLDLSALSAVTNTQKLSDVRLGYSGVLGTAYDVGAGKLMFVSADSFYDVYPVSLDFDAHAVSFGAGSNFAGASGSFAMKGGIAVLPEENIVFKTSYANGGEYQNKDVTVLLQAFDLSDNHLIDELKLKTLCIAGQKANAKDDSRIPVPFVVSVNENDITIGGSYLQDIKFNRSSGVFDKTGKAIDAEGYVLSNGSVWDTTASSSYIGYYPVLFLQNDDGTFLATGELSKKSGCYSPRSYRIACSKEICFGSIYARNGATCLQVLSKWTQTAYEAGVYDLENSSAVVQLSGEADQ